MEDSDDYELLPKREIEQLRKDVHSLKANPVMQGDKGQQLVQSIDRLTLSVNRLIAILDDAQKDIINEYQRSKPAQKLNQIMDQNETIAKALLTINDNVNGLKGQASPAQGSSSLMMNDMSPMGQMSPKMPSMNPPQMRPMMQPAQQFNPQPMPPLNDISSPSMNPPGMNDIPPLGGLNDMPTMDKPKKKFLGLI